ncbi:MAG TPA: Hsp20/alpha crystallin family protein [Acidimicrobiales bacterium]|nr:Hsp20/alpha crystallin family protein [Acidimicrobiales bacterium]
MALLRIDPFREVDRLSELAWGRVRPGVLPMDAYRRDQELVLEFDLPGADPESFEVTVEHKVLTVAAERRPERREGDQVVVSERPSGRFVRRLTLRDGLATDQVRASYDAGVLTVVIPTAEEVRTRRIEVQTGQAPAVAPVAAEEQPAA